MNSETTTRAKCPGCGMPTVPDHESLTAEAATCDACMGAAERDRLKKILRSLVSDIEGMQFPLRENEGDSEDRRAWFGNFTDYMNEDGDMVTSDGVRIYWPNLRILLDEAKAELAK